MKGSASIEMLAVLVVAIYMAAIVYKGTVVAGFQFTEDKYKVAMVRLAAEKIADTINALQVSAPGTTKKVEITLPGKTVSILRCKSGEKYIEFELNTTRKYDACNNTRNCSGRIKIGLECDKHWEIHGPLRRKVIAIVKIGRDKVRIGDPI